MQTLSVKRVPLDSIHPDPANVRLHDDRNLDAIKGSLVRFGQQKPIVVDRQGTIRAGNGTHAAARALGWTEIDVVETELEGVEAVAFAIADNRTSDLSSFDEPALAKLLQELQAQDAMEGAGYTAAELDELLAGLVNDVPEVLDDEVPGLPDSATTRRGDVWVIGRHRLMCGDSASAEDVDRLLAGASIHLVNTDPPYNVKVEPRSNNAIAAGLSSFTTTHHQGLDVARHPSKARPTHEKLRPKDRPLANDFLPEEEFDRMLRAWFGNVARVLLPGRAFYVWGGYANLGNYPAALRECGLYFSQGIVWNKEHPVLTRKDFMGAFELAFYGWREGAAHQFYGPANVPDLWAVKKLNHTATVHLTEIRANAFASSFLLPAALLMRIPDPRTWSENKAIDWANRLEVNPATLAFALSSAELIDQKTEDIIRKSKVPRAVKQDPEIPDSLTDRRKARKRELLERGLSDFHVKLCFDAYEAGHISAARMAEMLLVREPELDDLAALHGRSLLHGD